MTISNICTIILRLKNQKYRIMYKMRTLILTLITNNYHSKKLIEFLNQYIMVRILNKLIYYTYINNIHI